MIKTFDKFISESNFEKTDIIFKAEDVTKKLSFNVNFFEFELNGNAPTQDVEYDACIYVMPDDSVEIRNTEKGIILHGVIDGLDGQTVREKDLHRDVWHLHSED